MLLNQHHPPFVFLAFAQIFFNAEYAEKKMNESDDLDKITRSIIGAAIMSIGSLDQACFDSAMKLA